jgi:hypothetical protein
MTEAGVDWVVPPPVRSSVHADRFTKLTVFSLTGVEQDSECAVLPREIGVLGRTAKMGLELVWGKAELLWDGGRKQRDMCYECAFPLRAGIIDLGQDGESKSAPQRMGDKAHFPRGGQLG